MTDPITPDRDRIRAAYESAVGPWSDGWNTVLELDPDFVAATVRMHRVPEEGNHLSPKFRSLCFFAWNAAATHLNERGIREHARRSLAAGATPGELLEVIELVSTLGIHAMNIGVPLLVEVLEERGEAPAGRLTEYQEQLKQRFTEQRGYWHSFWDEMLELDPAMFDAYTEFSSVPWRTGSLTPAEKELIYVAFDLAATHLYVPGAKLHIRNALGYGATAAEVLEVLEIATLLGLDAASVSIPIFADELRRAEQLGG